MSYYLTKLFYKYLIDEINLNAYEYLKKHNFATDKIIQFAPDIKEIDMSYACGLHGEVNVIHADKVNLSHNNFQYVTNFVFNPYGKEINLSFVTGLYGKLDCSEYENLYLCETPLTKMYSIVGGKYTYMSGATDIFGIMDFRNSIYVDLSKTNLSKATLSFNLRGKVIRLSWVIDFPDVLNVGNTEKVVFTGAKMHNIRKIICGPNTKLINISSDFTGIIERATGKQMGKMMAHDKTIYSHHSRKQSQKFLHRTRQLIGNTNRR